MFLRTLAVALVAMSSLLASQTTPQPGQATPQTFGTYRFSACDWFPDSSSTVQNSQSPEFSPSALFAECVGDSREVM
jgi:hypothetical protein